MKIISMKQLREKFNPIRKGLNRGEEYLLLYRSKPLAMVVPYQNTSAIQSKKRPRPTFKPTTISVDPTPQHTAAVDPTPELQKELGPATQPAQSIEKTPSKATAFVSQTAKKTTLNRFGMKSILMPK